MFLGNRLTLQTNAYAATPKARKSWTRLKLPTIKTKASPIKPTVK
jgi:hypothetical protein